MHPYLFEIFGREVGTYGVCVVLGGAAAYVLMRLLARRSGSGGRLFALDDMTYVFMMCVAGGFLGAFLLRPITRIPEIIADWGYYRDMPSGVIMNYLFGEIVFYGGLLGGIAALLIYCKSSKVSPLPLADLAAPSVALAHAFGRVGCFFGGCCYGVSVDGGHPLGVRFPANTAGGAPPGEPLLAVQLIEAVCLLIIAAVLAIVYLKSKKAGFTVCLYGITYSVLRFVLEFYRGDLIRGVYGPFSTSQYISTFLLISSIILLTFLTREYKMKKPQKL